ncbi:MAG: PH domain-containing protein [Actinomycetes bacterium]
MDDLFAPPGTEWVRLSPKLRTLRRVLLLALMGPFAVAGVVLLAAFTSPWLAVLGALACLAAGAWWWVVIGRAWRAWGYAERDEDLVVTHGVLIRRLTVVPYGRMQFVDVTAGPLDRRFGIATVQLHTASAATDATIPGLTPDEAARLRDRLSAVGQARSAGL